MTVLVASIVAGLTLAQPFEDGGVERSADADAGVDALPADVITAGGGAEVIESGESTGLLSALKASVSGYLDLGLSRAEGGGKGFIFDTTDEFGGRFPEVAWVLLGDPLTTAVNSRGEPADTTGSFAFTHDPVNSEGALTFLVNEVNLDLAASPASSTLLFASLDFLPRSGNRGTLGDFFELDLAYVEWTPFESLDLTVTAGKYDSVFGREYRIQESPDRNGVTPSLLFRYVGGHPIGVKTRAKLFSEHLILALSAQNGSSFIELMQQAEEVDRNDSKTLAGRAAVAFDLPRGKLEAGVSGEAGAQARQVDSSLVHWQWGADGQLELFDLELRAEFVRGIAPGGGVEEVDLLDYRAFTVEAFYRVTGPVGVFARYEERHAIHRRADEFVYLIAAQRITAGARFDLNDRLILKAEYVLNRELGPLSQFPNDVVTASLVARF